MRTTRIVFASVLLMCLHASAWAQTAVPPQEPTAIRVGPALFTGYIQFDYLAAGIEALDADQFHARRVRLQLAGPLVSGIKWLVSAEATGTPVLRDAFIILDYLPAATVRIGQLVMPYGFERSVASSNTLEFTERILLDLAPGRDAGIVISNQRPFFGWLSYGAAIVNGTGQNTPDDNSAKDAMLRLSASPPRLRGLLLGVNVARGEQPAGIRTRTGADVGYENRSYHVAGEVLREQTQGGLRKQDGFYAMGSWRIYPEAPRRGFHHVELATRYGRLRGDDIRATRWDLALNYYVLPNLRVMCDLIVPADRRPADRGLGVHARVNIRF